MNLQNTHSLLSIDIKKEDIVTATDTMILDRLRNNKIKIKGFRTKDITFGIAKEKLFDQISKEAVKLSVQNNIKDHVKDRFHTSTVIEVQHKSSVYTYLILIAYMPRITVDYIESLSSITLSHIEISTDDIDYAMNEMSLRYGDPVIKHDVVSDKDYVKLVITSTNLPCLKHLLLKPGTYIVGCGQLMYELERNLIGLSAPKIHHISLDSGYYVDLALISIATITNPVVSDDDLRRKNIADSASQQRDRVVNQIKRDVEFMRYTENRRVVLASIAKEYAKTNISRSFVKDFENKSTEDIDRESLQLYTALILRYASIQVKSRNKDDVIQSLHDTYVRRHKSTVSVSDLSDEYYAIQWLIKHIPSCQVKYTSVSDFIAAQERNLLTVK